MLQISYTRGATVPPYRADDPNIRAPDVVLQSLGRGSVISRARGSATALVALLMPAGVTLDWFTHADWVSEFGLIRLGSSSAALLCLWMTYAGPWAERSIVLQTLPALIAAAGVEFMVVPLGAASSEYYAGLCLCIVALAVLHTWRWPRVLGLSTAILLMWLVPALPELIEAMLLGRCSTTISIS